MNKYLLVLLVILSCSLSLFGQKKAPKREFRGVWISTINNIDFPSSPHLSLQEQQTEFVNLLENYQKIGINAVIVQIRPAGDAFYKSPFEPWSYWLTGAQGRSPRYDPLEFMIDQCHKRAIEFHAWVNPFRAANSSRIKIAPQHVIKQHPEWIIKYSSQKILNLGLPEVRNYVKMIISDIAKRYDIDALHFDDYFYPYPQENLVFNDKEAFQNYNADSLSLEDWRRENVNIFIKSVSDTLHQIKPHIKFGISPFGIWRNTTQDEIGSSTDGIGTYDQLYVDTRKWLKNSWIDYIAPQLYWSNGFKQASYDTLAIWWTKNNFDRHLYTGHSVYKIKNNSDKQWNNLVEIPNQIRLNREENISGSIFFSSNTLLKNLGGIRDSLQNNLYAFPALLPLMSWKDSIAPLVPQNLSITNSQSSTYLTWKAQKKENPSYYVVYRFDENQAINIENPKHILAILPASQRHFKDSTFDKNQNYTYGITALDRFHNESEILHSERKITLEIPIQRVTLMSQKSKITRQISIHLDKGASQITFEKLSAELLPTSLTVKMEEKADLKSVQHKIQLYQSDFKAEDLELFRDTLNTVSNRIAVLGDSLQIWEALKSVLLKNETIENNSLEKTQDFLTFFAKKLSEVNSSIQSLKSQIREEKNNKKRLLNQINDFEKAQKEYFSQVKIQVWAENDVNLNLNLDYLIDKTNWNTKYKLYIPKDKKNTSARLVHKVNIRQETGINWKAVKLALVQNTLSKSQNIASEFSQIYLPLTYDLPSTSQERTILVRDTSMVLNYEYQVDFAKNDTLSFVAQIPNWKAYQIKKGEIELYFDNIYAGKSELKFDNRIDTASIFLGEPHDVFVKRDTLINQRKSTLALFGQLDRGFEIILKNTKKEAISIIISDQVPFFADPRIKTTSQTDGQEQTSKNGLIIWKLKLKASETRKVIYSYSIKYPKKMEFLVK